MRLVDGGLALKTCGLRFSLEANDYVFIQALSKL